MDVNLKNVVKGKILFKYYRSYKKNGFLCLWRMLETVYFNKSELKLTFGILETVRPMLHRMVHQVEAVW